MFSSLLLAWYDQHKRVLSFRGTKDPYRIWVSEIMLQQTRTETVAGYYNRFLARFPDVFALADAPEEDVLKCWEGLGYYSRARNLHKAAKVIAKQYEGRFPADLNLLRALPGVGDYTAAAVASIAFDLPAPAMDGNLTRVLSRFHGVREDVDIPAVKRRLLALGQEDMPETRCGDFNQALMDLGAMVCTPGTPDCDACPLRPLCSGYREGDADALPIKAAAKPPKEIRIAVALITCQGRVWMAQRKETLLKNLWVYQLTDDFETPDDAEKAMKALGIHAKYVETLGTARHVFTHRVWNMTLFHYEAEIMRCKEGRFVTLPEMLALPIPTAMKAAKEQAVQLLKISIFPAEEIQLSSLAAVYSASWRQSHASHCGKAFLEKHIPEQMEARLKEHQSKGRMVYGLWINHKAVGVMVLDAHENELNLLYIHPNYQGIGVGTQALDFAVYTLDAGKPMKVTVLCGNERANSLYASFGFTYEAAFRVLDAERGLSEHDLLRLPKIKGEDKT